MPQTNKTGPKVIFGGKFYKCSYTSKPGLMARIKCVNCLKGSCKCVIKVLIGSTKNGSDEVFDEQFIVQNSDELHSKT